MTQRPEPYEGLVSDGDVRPARAARGRSRAHAGMSLAGLALAWLLADPRVTQVVVGPGTPEHLDAGERGARPPACARTRRRLLC